MTNVVDFGNIGYLRVGDWLCIAPSTQQGKLHAWMRCACIG